MKMKIRNFSVILTVSGVISLSPVSGYAQKIAFDQGDKIFQAGVGLGYGGLYGDSTIPPISGTFEMGYNDNISLGGFVAYTSSEDIWSTIGGEEYGWEYSYIGIGARGAYHYGLFDSENIDTYAGLTLGYNMVSVSTIGSGWSGSASGSYLLSGGFVGLRYFFQPNMAVFTELGYGGLGNAVVGLSFKF
jgi:hypothetical protein